MLISMHRHGGLAAVPGLELQVAVNTADLPKAEADELEKAVHDAAIIDMPSTTAPAGGGDRRIYDLTVQDGERTRSVTLTDPIQQPAVAALIRLLTSRGRPLR
jgi:hypothetical protein